MNVRGISGPSEFRFGFVHYLETIPGIPIIVGIICQNCSMGRIGIFYGKMPKGPVQLTDTSGYGPTWKRNIWLVLYQRPRPDRERVGLCLPNSDGEQLEGAQGHEEE